MICALLKHEDQLPFGDFKIQNLLPQSEICNLDRSKAQKFKIIDTEKRSN